VTLDDDVAATVDQVQLSLKLEGRDQQVEMRKLNSKALVFMAPSQSIQLSCFMLFYLRLVVFIDNDSMLKYSSSLCL